MAIEKGMDVALAKTIVQRSGNGELVRAGMVYEHSVIAVHNCYAMLALRSRKSEISKTCATHCERLRSGEHDSDAQVLRQIPACRLTIRLSSLGLSLDSVAHVRSKRAFKRDKLLKLL